MAEAVIKRMKEDMLANLREIERSVEFYKRYIPSVPEEGDVNYYHLVVALSDCIYTAMRAFDEMQEVRYVGMPRHADYEAGRIHPRLALEGVDEE